MRTTSNKNTHKKKLKRFLFFYVSKQKNRLEKSYFEIGRVGCKKERMNKNNKNKNGRVCYFYFLLIFFYFLCLTIFHLARSGDYKNGLVIPILFRIISKIIMTEFWRRVSKRIVFYYAEVYVCVCV